MLFPGTVYTVFLEALEFYAYHGVSAEEQRIGHRYLASIWLQVHGSADLTDDIKETVDYGDLGLFIQNLGTSNQVKTVERLAAMMCDAVLEKYPLVEEVRLLLAKRLPPAPLIAATAGVDMVRKREDLDS